MTHAYGYDPDWYSHTLRPEFVPVLPDKALAFHRELVNYVKHYPYRCMIRRDKYLPVDTVDCLVPGLGTVTYLYMEQSSLTVFLTDEERDYERVYRYLFLDQHSEEESHAVHQIRTYISRPERCIPETIIRTRLESNVLCSPRVVDVIQQQRRGEKL